MHHAGHADIGTIARNASLYDWLISRSRSRRLDHIPGHLHNDIGLTAPERQRDWSGWRPFG